MDESLNIMGNYETELNISKDRRNYKRMFEVLKTFSGFMKQSASIKNDEINHKLHECMCCSSNDSNTLGILKLRRVS